EQVIESLVGKAKSIKHVALPDGFHDVSDYIASLPADKAQDIIRALIDETPLVELQSLVRSEGPEWPEPQPLPADLPSVPLFNFDCLPDTLRPWIKDIAQRMQCPPDFPAIGAMVALGSLVGRKIGIRPKRRDDWLEIPNLWGGIIAPPGMLKTPALQQALLMLRRLASKAWERYEEEKREYDINDMLGVQSKKLLETEIKKELKKGDKRAAREKAA